MTPISVSVAAAAAAPLSDAPDSVTKAGAIASAAQYLLLHLERGQSVDVPMLRTAMENAFGASDADGGWDWKTAYDACETATVLFVRKFGPALRARAASPAAMLPMLAKIVGLLKVWLSAGSLMVVEGFDEQRRPREFVQVCDAE